MSRTKPDRETAYRASNMGRVLSPTYFSASEKGRQERRRGNRSKENWGKEVKAWPFCYTQSPSTGNSLLCLWLEPALCANKGKSAAELVSNGFLWLPYLNLNSSEIQTHFNIWSCTYTLHSQSMIQGCT